MKKNRNTKKTIVAGLSVLIAVVCVTGALFACGKKGSGTAENTADSGSGSGSGFEKVTGNANGQAEPDIPGDSILYFKGDPGLARLMEDMKAGDIPVECNVLYDTMGARPDVTVKDAGKIREIYDRLSRMTVGEKSNTSVTDSYHHVSFHLRNDSYVSVYFEGENLLSWGQENYAVSGGDALWSYIMQLQDDVIAADRMKAAEEEKAEAAASAEKAKAEAEEKKELEEDEETEAETAEDSKKTASEKTASEKKASEKTSADDNKSSVKKTVTKKTTTKKGGTEEKKQEGSGKETEKKSGSDNKVKTEEKKEAGNTGLDRLPAQSGDETKPAGEETEKEKPAEKKEQDQEKEEKPSSKDTDKKEEEPSSQDTDKTEEQPSGQDTEKEEEQPSGQDAEKEEEQPSGQDKEQEEEPSGQDTEKEEEPSEQDTDQTDGEPAAQENEEGEEQAPESADTHEGLEELPGQNAGEEEDPDTENGEMQEQAIVADDAAEPGRDTEEDEETGDGQKAEQDTETEEETAGETPDTAALDAAYTEIVRAYAAVLAQDPDAFLEAYENGAYGSGAGTAEDPETPVENAAVDERLNYEMIREILERPEGSSIYYGLRDYNGDGTPELVVALGTMDFKHIWAGYTFDGRKAVPLFTGPASLGYRVDLYTLPDGLFMIHGSGGAMAGRDTICRIRDDRSGLEILAEYDYDAQMNGNMDHIGASETLTEEEFEERYRKDSEDGAKGVAFYTLTADSSVVAAEQAPAAETPAP